MKNPNAGPSHDLLMKPNYMVSFRTNSDATAWRIHPEADELWFVRRGSAKVILADFTLMVGIAGGTAKEYAASAGDVVNVPRNQGYRILPSPGPFDYVAVRVFPEKRHTPLVGLGAGAEPKPMPPLIAKAEIESKLASIGKNENVHSSGAVILNYIVAPPSWPQPAIPEAHLTCDDLYFVRLGSARIAVDGYIVNPKEQPAAEIHGEKAIGAREYTVGAGDLISIPRNTMHAITPESARFGYLLVKVCD
jgi:mannose-6-phosphate isomerase-like protein (cupin superfamily)